MNNKGFTLVEVIVVGLLALILVGAGLATFLVFTEETSKAAECLRGQVQADALLEEIARKANEANYFARVNEPKTENANKRAAYLHESADNYSDEVFFYKFKSSEPDNNPPFAGFRIEKDEDDRWVVQEWDITASDWKDFTVGGSQVEILRSAVWNYTGGSSDNPFRLVPLNYLTRLQVGMTIKSDACTFKIDTSTFRCKFYLQ